MKERPILFSGPMVRAILEGRKTQTRRIAKDRDGITVHPNGQVLARGGWLPELCCPYGKPGDRLWVKETFQMHTTLAGIRVTYREGNADAWIEPPETWEGIPDDNHWRPSLFMPRWASRITLEIESVRVERLQEISEEDAIAEGIIAPRCELCGYTFADARFQMDHRLCKAPEPHSATLAYRELWESINGPGSWDANPWVWVIQFRRITP